MQFPIYFVDFLRTFYEDRIASRLVTSLPALNYKSLIVSLSGFSDPGDFTDAIWNGKIPTFVPLFQQAFGADSSFEACILCPYSNTQIQCLNALNERWGFALQTKTRSEMTDDVVTSVYFEIIRILTHPFLSGASEEAICEMLGGSWEDCFVKASSKVAFLNSYIAEVASRDGTNAQTSQSRVFIYCSSLLMCLYLERFFQSKNVELVSFARFFFFIRRLFGVRTLQECNADVKRINSHSGPNVCVVLLGALPNSVHLSLETIDQLFIFHSDMNLDSDVTQLESTFTIPRSARIYRLITACSLEMNLLLPDKHVAKEFQYLLNRGTNKFVFTLK